MNRQRLRLPTQGESLNPSQSEPPAHGPIRGLTPSRIHNPPGNLRAGDTRTIAIRLTDRELPQPRLEPSRRDGEAESSRAAFVSCRQYQRDSVIEFLKSLQVLPPRTKSFTVDGRFHPKRWRRQDSLIASH